MQIGMEYADRKHRINTHKHQNSTQAIITLCTNNHVIGAGNKLTKSPK